MIEVESKVKQWGNSFGVIIPKEIADVEHIRKNEKIRFAILRENRAVKESFGMLKNKKRASSQAMKDLIRRELHNG